MPRDAFIFLNRKLISCDTAAPLALELKAISPRSRLKIILSDEPTARAIRLNRVLYDAISSVAEFVELGRPEGTSRYGHRTRIAPQFLALLAAAAANRAAVLHFKALDEGALSLFYKVARNRTYACQNNIYGLNRVMWRLTYETRSRPAPELRAPNARYLVAFSNDWPLLASEAVREFPCFYFGPTRRRKLWLDFVRSRADTYISEEFAKVGWPTPDEFFSVMLGTFQPLPYLRTPDTVQIRLEQMLRVLARQANGRPIVLKPHMITDMDLLRNILSRIPDGRFLISHLHVMVLAQRSRLVASNYYSTTLGDAAMIGVPTIEFTDYSDRALAFSEGHSMRPEFVSHFVNGDESELDRRITQISGVPRGSMIEGDKDDPSGLLQHLGTYLNDHRNAR
jgi:hypothetical protein